jgi:ribose transport system substrate-binding protein
MALSSSRKAPLLAAVVTALLLGLAACSSSGPSSSGSSSPSASSSSSTSSQVAAAQTAATAVERGPTVINMTTPLKSKPAPGKTFVFFNCGFTVCTILGNAIEAAVQSAGWKFRQITFNSADPATLVQAMQQALRYHPSYVSLTGLPAASGWGTEIPAYQKAGVKIVAAFLGPTTTTSTVIANVAGPAFDQELGADLAQFFIADSGGKGQALIETVTDEPSVLLTGEAFANTVKAGCSGCSTTTLGNTQSQVVANSVTSTVVADLRSHPSINYLFIPAAGVVPGVPSALASVGLADKVKYLAAEAAASDLDVLKSGKAAAMIGNPLRYTGYLIVDAALRSSEGMTVDPSPTPPVQLVTPNSTFAAADTFDVPANFVGEFATLWHTS